MEHDDENPFGEGSLAVVRNARSTLERMPSTPGPVADAVPMLGKISPFLADAATIVPAGSPAPRLVRSALALGKAVAAAVTDPFRRPPAAASDTVAGMGASASLAAARDLARLSRAASDNARSDRKTLSGLGKFVEGAIVLRAGNATDAAPLLTLTRRLAVAGIVGGFSLVIAPDDAAAWGQGHGQGRQFGGMAVARPVPNQNYNRPNFNPGAVEAWRERRAERRDERRSAMVATGAVIAGAIIGSRLSNGGGYGNGYAQPYVQPYARPYGAYPQQPYASPQAYGAYGGGYPQPQAYGPRPGVPSDGFVLDAKKLIAMQVGSVHRADGILDQAIHQGVACIRQMGPDARCTTRTHGIMLDFSQGEFIATANGQPVMMERGGIIQRFNHAILAEADAQSRNIMAQENGQVRPGYNGY